ncbi:ABC transporter substrate-binding protein [Peptostreptococcaceae bacterium AGR-M142]
MNKNIKIMMLVAVLFIFLYYSYINFFKTEELIKIGFVGSLTGKGSELGVATRKGVFMAADKINRSGGINGKKIKLIIKDDKTDRQKAKEVINEFENENINIIIGFSISGMYEAVVDADKKGMFIISPTMTTIKLSQKDDNFTRVLPENSKQSDYFAKIIGDKGSKKIGVIYDDDNREYASPIIQRFKNNLKDLDIKLAYERRFNKFDMNAELFAKDIKRLELEAIYMVCNSTDAAKIIQQIDKLEYNIDKYASSWAFNEELLSYGGKTVEGVYGASEYNYLNNDEKYLDFEADYRHYYNEEVTFGSLFGYETMMVLKEAMKNADTLEPSDIKKSFLKIKKFEGIQSDITYDEYLDASRESFIYRVENSKFKRVFIDL